MGLNFNFPDFSGSFGLWIKRIIKLLIIIALLFGSYYLYKWSDQKPIKYRIAMDSDWYPLALYGKQHNITAFTNDLIALIARNQGINVEMIRTSNKRLLELLDAKNVEGILTSMTPDLKLEEKYTFSDPYYRYGAVLITGKDSTIHSLQELDRKRMGIKRSSPLLYRLHLNCDATIIGYNNDLQALHALSENKVDAVIVEQLLTFLYFGSFYPDQLRVATQPLTSEGLRLMSLKKDDKLVEMFNSGLKSMKDNGSYDHLLDEWDIFDPEKL